MDKTPIDLVLLRRRMVVLQGVRFAPASFAKGFVHGVCTREPEQLSQRQALMVAKLCWQFRRQLPADLVPDAEPVMPARPEPPPKSARQARPRPRRVGPDLVTAALSPPR